MSTVNLIFVEELRYVFKFCTKYTNNTVVVGKKNTFTLVLRFMSIYLSTQEFLV